MKKTIPALIFLCLSACFVKAQTVMPAPQKFDWIVEVNTPVFFKYVSPDVYNNSKTVHRFIDDILFSYNIEYSSLDDSMLQIKDYGIDLQKKIYLHQYKTDSSTYKINLIPLSNAKLFKDFLITTTGSLNSENYRGGEIVKLDKKALVYIQPQYAVAIQGNYDYSFLTDSVNSKRYGIENPYDYTTVDSAQSAEVEYEDTAIDAAANAAAAVEDSETKEPIITDTVVDNMADSILPETEEDPYSRFYYQADSIAYVWTQAYLEQLLNSSFTTQQQLEKLKNYQPLPADALAAFYMKGDAFSSIYGGYANPLAYIFGYNGKPKPKPETDDWSSYTLRMQDNDLLIDGKYYTAQKNIDLVKKMYKKKLDKKVLKYLNDQKDLGGIYSSFNMENYLNIFPDLMTNIYNGKSTKVSAANIAADFMKIMLDEREIAKLFTGDALFVANGVKSKSVRKINYTTDTVDFDTKIDTVYVQKNVPTFLGLFTTKREDVIGKWLQYAVNKELLIENNGIYSIREADKDKVYSYIPYPLSGHFLLHKGMLFFTTELEDIQKIKNNTYHGSLTSASKKELHNSYGWWNMNSLQYFLEPPANNEARVKDAQLRQVLKKFSRMTLIYPKIDNKSYGGVFSVKMADGYQGNALQALLELIDVL